jgi:uncharacterized protein YoxC
MQKLALKNATKVVKAKLCSIENNNNRVHNLKTTTMASFGKKFLSAFVELAEDEKSAGLQEEKQHESTQVSISKATPPATNEKFRQYFDKLFKDANLPGPDYFEFSKMIEAMQGIPDEKARYTAVFAGLNAQGLDKQKLLNTATQYIQVLETDANNFNNTVDAALKEKVQGKQQEIETTAKRIGELNREITELGQRITQLQQEVKDNEEKIENNSGAYLRESQAMKNKMLQEVEKIKQYVNGE